MTNIAYMLQHSFITRTIRDEHFADKNPGCSRLVRPGHKFVPPGRAVQTAKKTYSLLLIRSRNG